MSQPETIFSNDIRLQLGKLAPHCRLFRNVSGLLWAGRLKGRSQGCVVLHSAQQVQAGLTPGAADLIGWTTITVTPDMVGQKLAVFTSGELKIGKRALEDDQMTWRDNVREAGGFAEEIRTLDDAMKLVRAK